MGLTVRSEEPHSNCVSACSPQPAADNLHSENQSLNPAQKAAQKALERPWLPHYDSKYIESKTGLTWAVLSGYKKGYDACAYISQITYPIYRYIANTITYIASQVLFIGDQTIGRVIRSFPQNSEIYNDNWGQIFSQHYFYTYTLPSLIRNSDSIQSSWTLRETQASPIPTDTGVQATKTDRKGFKRLEKILQASMPSLYRYLSLPKIS